MKLKNHSRRSATGYSSEEAEVPATSPNDEYKEIKSLQSKATATTTSRNSSKRRHKSRGQKKTADAAYDDDDYYQRASHFYTPSVVVETIYRRPQAFADLHQFDEETEIDNVPTAVGFHSMDSAEEVGMARSTGKRYEMDEIRPIVVQAATDPDPSIKSSNLSEVLRTLTAATTDTREPEENQQADEDQVTIDDDIRYGHAREETGFPALDVILKATHSEDSESCPPIWKTESQEEPRDRDWMIAEAKRVRELNSVTVPKKILQEYETSQIIRQPVVESTTDKYQKGSGAKAKWSRALRKLLAGRASNDSANKNHDDVATLGESTAPPPTSTKSVATSSVAHGGGKDAKSQVSRTSSKKSKAYSTSTSKKQVESNDNATASWKDDDRDDKEVERQSDGSSKCESRQSKSSSRYHQVQSVSSKDNGMTKSSKDGKTTKSVSSNKSRGTITAKDPPTKLQEIVEEREEDRNVSSKSTVQSESIFTMEESKQEGVASKSEYKTKGPFEATTRTANEDNNNNDLIAASRSNDDNDDDDGESTNMDGDGTQLQEEISLQETATTQGGYGLTDWVISGFDNLANIGFNKPMFGFLDWSGEEKMIEKLEAATTAKGATTAVRGSSNNGTDKKLPPKTNMTKRLLSKVEIKARLIEGHARRQQENQVGERNRERHENRDPDGAPASSSSSPRRSSGNVTSPSSPRYKARHVVPSGSESIEVRTLTLDEGDKQQAQSHGGTKKSLTDSTQKQQEAQPVANKEGLTIQFPTPSFAKGSKKTSVTGGSKDEDDTSTSLLGLEKRKTEKPTKNPPPSLSDATKKFREQQQQQSKNKKTLFGPFRLQNKKQQTKP